MVINLSILLTDLKNISRISLQAALVNTPLQFCCAINKRQFSFPTGFIEMYRAQQCVPWGWTFEIVIMAADELHTFCSYRWISRELVHSNSWRFVWIFEALLARPSSYFQLRNNDLLFTAGPLSIRTLSNEGKKAQIQTLVKPSILIERTSNFKILSFERETLK